jgi:hypothetical protein
MTATPHTVKSNLNGKKRIFFILSESEWIKINFTNLKPGDRFIFKTPGEDKKSGIFIVVTEPYYSFNHKTHMVESLPHNDAPVKETITFQEIRESVKNSGITPVFLEDDKGNLSAFKSSHMSISGALILKIA